MATDLEIRNAGFKYIPQQQYLQNPFEIPVAKQEEDVINTTLGIPNTNAFINSGGGSSYPGSPNNLIQDYNLATQNYYFDNQKTPLVDDLYQSKLDKTFLGFPSYRQVDQIGPFTPYNRPMDMDNPAASIENIIASRNVPLELTGAGKIQSNLEKARDATSGIMSNIGGFGPISFLANKLDKFGSLPTADQKFIQMNMGYTGPTVFGENASGGYKDPYGINTRSMFGNYAEYVDDAARSDLTDEEYDALTDFQKTKVDFYREQKKEREEIRDKEYQDRIDSFVTNYNRPGVKEMFDTVYDGTNIHGGDNTTDGTTTTGGDGFTGSGNFSNIDNSGKNYGPHSQGGEGASQTREQAGPGFSGSGTAAEMGSFRYGGLVPAAPSQLVSESDIILGYRGDDAYGGGDGNTNENDGDNNREQYGAVNQYSTGPTSTQNTNDEYKPPKMSIIDRIKYNPFINNPITRTAARVGLYTVNPSLLGLDYRTAAGLKGVYDTATEEVDDEDVTLFKNGGLASIL